MPTPFIHLSDQCEITDISDKFKSLPGKPEGKDFLRSIQEIARLNGRRFFASAAAEIKIPTKSEGEAAMLDGILRLIIRAVAGG